jgi:hypothetical protein
VGSTDQSWGCPVPAVPIINKPSQWSMEQHISRRTHAIEAS